jgi:hypothetical protein
MRHRYVMYYHAVLYESYATFFFYYIVVRKEGEPGWLNEVSSWIT